MQSKTEKPYVIYLAELIYKSIVDIKKNNSDISNIPLYMTSAKYIT